MAKIINSLKKLSFLGDFSAFLFPLVLIIIAGLLFVPTTLMQRKLRAQIEEQSIKKGQKAIENLLRDPVSNKQWEFEKAYQDLYQLDANGIALLAEQTSLRALLSYDIFPEPNETSQQIYSIFGRNFRSLIDKMFEELKSRDCPTQAELDKYLKQPAGSGVAESEETTRTNTEQMVRDDLCMAVAKATILYSNKNNFSGYKFWENYNYKGHNEAIGDCWYWQLGSWIIEDVLQTAKELNSGSASVLASPLKRIIAVSFTPESTSTSGATTTYGTPDMSSMYSAGILTGTGRPKYVLSFTDCLAEPFNGRKCNDQADIVHFRLSVVVSAYAVPEFLEELCNSKEHTFGGFHNEFKDEPRTLKHNQITILKCSFDAVDSESEEHKLYRYGNDSVVKMDLVCEYAFNKRGYASIVPKIVKDTLDKALQPKTATRTPPPGYPGAGAKTPKVR
jgi:hypothetical protein